MVPSKNEMMHSSDTGIRPTGERLKCYFLRRDHVLQRARKLPGEDGGGEGGGRNHSCLDSGNFSLKQMIT